MEEGKLDSKRFFCIVDKALCPMDYIEGEIGVRLTGFDLDKIEEGGLTITLYTFDISKDDFYNVKSKKGNNYVHWFSKRFFDEEYFSLVTVELDSNSESCFYASYGSNEPINIRIKSIAFQSYNCPNFRNHQLAISYLNKVNFITQNHIKLNHLGGFRLMAYSVGQGMCSLIHNGSEGYLLDAGAGTPVIRGNYQKKLIINDLVKEVQKLKDLSLILSHLDSDHFRIIRWDPDVLKKIRTIYIPSGFKWLDSKETKIASKVIAVNRITISSSNLTLQALRTAPQNLSAAKNDNELICHLKLNGRLNILYPGDYTYKKMLSDSNNSISSLTTYKYEFVVVPHHGDFESQFNIPFPNSNESQAFFSAGNHKSWQHPNPNSVSQHKSQGFLEITCKYSTSIKEVARY